MPGEAKNAFTAEGASVDIQLGGSCGSDCARVGLRVAGLRGVSVRFARVAMMRSVTRQYTSAESRTEIWALSALRGWDLLDGRS